MATQDRLLLFLPAAGPITKSITFGWTFDTNPSGYDPDYDDIFINGLSEKYQEWNDQVFAETAEMPCPESNCSGVIITISADPDTGATAVRLNISDVPWVMHSPRTLSIMTSVICSIEEAFCFITTFCIIITFSLFTTCIDLLIYWCRVKLKGAPYEDILEYAVLQEGAFNLPVRMAGI